MSNQLDEPVRVHASHHKEFVEIKEGFSLEKVLGFIKKLEIDARKHVYVVSMQITSIIFSFSPFISLYRIIALYLYIVQESRR